MPAFPLAGPHRASGLASNVVRRSAAHNFGKNATPAVGKSRLGRRGFQQSHVHPKEDIRSTTPGCQSRSRLSGPQNRQ